LLAAVASITSCVGGPVSDLPNSGDTSGGPRPGDGDDEGSGRDLDAGLSAPRDGGAPPVAPDADIGIPCDDAGLDTGGG
jgi:hypothetical protein